MTELHQKFLLLRPMRTGVSGFARMQWERGQAWVQLNVRGAPGEGIRAFWYSSGGEARELGTCAANARGEASLEGSVPGDRYAPERLQALIVVENNVAPRPLLIGLCTETSAGSLLDAKNASLSLCDKLARAAVKRRQPVEPKPTDAPVQRKETLESRTPTAAQAPVFAPDASSKPVSAPTPAREKSLPREIFLPALDPAPYVQAMERPMKAAPSPRQDSVAPTSAVPPPQPEPTNEKKPSRAGVPVGRLPNLEWPKAFRSLREYFVKCPPDAPFDWPGWRFVRVSRQGDGLWIGRQIKDSRVWRVAYAMRGAPPRDDPRPYQPVRGRNGELYRVLVQRA